MLAGIGNYLHLEWQLPIIIVFLVGWIVGGGWLLRKLILRRDRMANASMERCALTSVLAGSAGAMCGVIGAYITDTILKATEVEMMPLTICVGATCALFVMFIVVFAMFDFSAATTAKVMILPILFIMVLGAVTATAAGLPAYYIHQNEAKRETSKKKLWQIRYSIVDDFQRKFGRPPKDLGELVEQKMIDQNLLDSPFMPEGQIGYFYLPSQLTQKGNDSDNRLLVCDLHTANVNGQAGRCAAMVSNACRWFTADEFDKYLTMPENQEFAAALKAAEAKK